MRRSRRHLTLTAAAAASALCSSTLCADAQEKPAGNRDINALRRQLRRPRAVHEYRSPRDNEMEKDDNNGANNVVVKSIAVERQVDGGVSHMDSTVNPRNKGQRYLASDPAASNPGTGTERGADKDQNEDDSTLLVRVDMGTLEHATRERARAKGLWLEGLEENGGMATSNEPMDISGTDRGVTAPASATGAGRSTTTATNTVVQKPVEIEEDEEDSTTVPVPQVILERHRRLFLTHNLHDYTFDYYSSQDDINGWIRIHVVDGSVGYATTVTTGTLLPGGVVSTLPTMEDIFAKVDDVYDTKGVDPNEVFVDYDEDVAYPVLIRYGSTDDGDKSVLIRTRNLTKEGGSVSHPCDHDGISQSPGNPNAQPDSNSKGTSTRTTPPSNPTLSTLSYHQVRWSNFQVVDYDFVISIGRRRARNNRRRQQSGIKVQVRSGRVINTPSQSKLSPAMRKLLSCMSGTIDKVGGLGSWGEGLPELPTMEEVYSFLASSYRSTPRKKRRGIRIRYNSEVAYPTTARMPLACSTGTSAAQHKMVTFNIRNVNIIKEGGTSPDLVNPDPTFDDKVQEAYNMWVEWGYGSKTANYWFRYKRECEVGMPPEDCRAMCVTVTDGQVSDVRYAKDDSDGNTDADSVCEAADLVPEDQADNVPSITDLLEMMLPSSPGRAVSGTFDSTWGYAISGHIVDRPDTTMPFRFEVQEFDLLYPNAQPSVGDDGPALVGPGGGSTMCPADVRVCTNNQNKVVTRVPPSCNFASCEEEPVGDKDGLLPNGCDATPKVCEDGSSIYMRGVPPNCVYPPCTPPGVHDRDKDGPLKQPANDRDSIGSDGKPLACRLITKLCDDGLTYVALDPKTDCKEYQECPQAMSGNKCDTVPFQCEDGGLVYKRGVPPNCEYPPCTPPGVHNPDKDGPLQQPPQDRPDDPTVCKRISKLCDDKRTYVALDPKTNCEEFEACPPLGGPELVSGTPEGIKGEVGWDNIQESRLRPINNGFGMTQGQGAGKDTHVRDDHRDWEWKDPT